MSKIVRFLATIYRQTDYRFCVDFDAFLTSKIYNFRLCSKSVSSDLAIWYIYIYSPLKMIMLKYVANDQYNSEKYVRSKVIELKKCT